MNLLLEAGADLYSRNEKNISPLDEIIRNDNIELLKCVYKPSHKSQSDFGLIHLSAGVEDSKCLRLFLTL